MKAVRYYDKEDVRAEEGSGARSNLVSFARAVRGREAYPITAEHLVNNIALLEAIFASAKSGRIETVA